MLLPERQPPLHQFHAEKHTMMPFSTVDGRREGSASLFKFLI